MAEKPENSDLPTVRRSSKIFPQNLAAPFNDTFLSCLKQFKFCFRVYFGSQQVNARINPVHHLNLKIQRFRSVLRDSQKELVHTLKNENLASAGVCSFPFFLSISQWHTFYNKETRQLTSQYGW
ncbi:hypothetical protein CEXT_361691 [Caerostris extrusa]|uniref:Uncharacterized protein n=1 Tax=Caerostris extrusa TaxID=172846 RepID=A0AAV4WIF6_CAEEX|nr:hypothetical protein CEXT_361691 [Caerostris extrusa]